MKMIRRSLIVGAMALLSMTVFAGQPVGPASTTTLSIPAQSLRDALMALGRQTGLQVVYTADQVTESLKAPSVEGAFTAQAALERMLKDSGLSYRFLNPNTVAIRSADVAAVTSGASGENSAAAVHLAQGEDSSPSKGKGEGTGEDQKEPSSDLASREDKSVKTEEIVVTAQRRKQKLEDVPISISVFSGERLDMSSETSVNNALFSVPGLNIDTITAGGMAKISIRGVSSLLGSSTVGYYVDGVPFGFVASDFSPDPGTFDLDRVEVLRGPQGTLYGANSLNGVVRVLTEDADLNDYELKGRALLSSVRGGGENFGGDAVVNAPIVPGKLAARLLVSYDRKAGYIDNLVADEINAGKITNIRLKINAQPTDDLSAKLGYWRQRNHSGSLSLSYEDRDFYPGELPVDNSANIDVYSGSIAYDFGSFKASNTAGYIDYLNRAMADWSAFPNALPLGIDGIFILTQTSKVFSNELSLTSQSEGSWAWSAGAIYRDTKDQVQSFNTFFGQSPIGQDESTSYAVFGELTRYFADGALELTGGLRYFHDKVRQSQPGGTYDLTSTFNPISPRAVLTWHPNDNTTVYASYAQGFRSGLNQSAATEAAFPGLPPAKEDKLNNYEIGSKGKLFDGFLSYEVAAYYIDWSDVKQNLCTLVGAFCQTLYVNTGTAQGPGVDVGLTFHPAEKLSLGVTGSWNDLHFTDDVFFGTDILYNKGERPAGSTEYTLGGWINYRTPLGGTGLEGGLSGSVDHKSATLDVFVNGRTVGDPITDSRLAFQVAKPDAWTFEVFCDNLLDERGSRTRGSFIPFYHNRFVPRTIGAQLSFQF